MLKMNKILLYVLLFSVFIISVNAALEDDNRGYYSFDDSDLTGSNPDDLSGNGVTATNTNVNTGSGGIINEAFDFPSSSYLNMGDNFDLGTSASFSFWVNTTQTGTTTRIIFKNTGAPNRAYIIFLDSGIFSYDISDDGTAVTSQTFSHSAINDGSYHHVVITWASSTMKIYIDGVLKDTIINVGFDEVYDNSVNFNLGSQVGSNQFLGSIDEFSFWNKTLDDNSCSDESTCGGEIAELWNGGSGNNFYDVNVTASDSTESTAVVKQIGTITTTGPTSVTVFSSDFNITVNNTDLYGAYSFNVLSAGVNTLFCELEIDGVVVGNVTRTQVPTVLGSVYIQSEIFSLENGTHTQALICQRSSGVGQITISNAVGIGHILIDENLDVVPHNETISSTTVTSGSSYSLLDEINFTISNRTIGGVDDIQHMMVLEWSGNYENNFGSNELLTTYISINDTNCSFYPRNVASGTTGSVSGDCLIKNATQNATYNIKFYGNGSSAVYDIDLKVKEFLLSPEEIEGGTGFPVPTSFSGDTDVLLFNFTGGNLNHGLTNVFQKNSFSIKSNESTTAVFYVELVNGTNYTTVNFTRDITSNVGVLIGHDVLQNVPQDNYVSKLWANCGSPTAECTIVGGDGIGYITDITSTISNSFNISLFDYYDNSSINGFVVTNGASFSTTGSWLLFFSSGFFENLTVSTLANDYFPTTILNHNTSNDLNVSLNQTLIKWDCVEKITGKDLNCTSPTESTIFNYNVAGNPHSQSLNVSGYFENIEVFNVTALQNNTLTSTFGSSNITLTVTSSVGNPSICSYNVTSYANPSFLEVVSGSPNSSITLINGSYNVLVDCDGFAFTNKNFTVENVTQTINIDLFTTNSVNLSFFSSKTGSLLNGTNITVTFIGATAQTNNTVTGYLYIDLLNPSQYTILFSADGYRQGSYIFTLDDRENIQIPLFMELENDTELVLISVVDKFSKDPIQNAIVTIQKYKDDAWVTDQIVSTDFQGLTEAYFVLSTQFYNFIVEFQDQTFFGVLNSNENKKTIFAEDVTNGINIEIDTSPTNTVPIYQSSYDVIGDVRFNNHTNTSGYFIFQFDDTNNIAREVVLNVTHDGVVVCNNTVTSESGNLNCFVSVTLGDVELFTGTGFVKFGDEWVPMDVATVWVGIDETVSFDWESTGLGYILGFFVVLVAFLLFAKIPSMSLLSGTISFVLLVVFRVLFSGINLGLLSGFLFGAYLLSRIPSKSGVNA